MKKQTQFWSLLSMIAIAMMAFVVWQISSMQAMAGSTTLPGDAKSTFDGKCATCHGKDGRGKTFKGRMSHARDLTAAEWQNDVTDERIFNSISNGRNKMPAFKKKLTEAQIEELVGYVRRFKH